MQKKTKTLLLILAGILTATLFFVGCSSNSNKDNHEHEWTNYVVRDVSCTVDGLLERICTCGKKDYVSIPKNGHNRNADGECVICGDGKKEETHTHNFEWTTIFESTCEFKGIKKGVCECGQETLQDINPKGHNRNSDGECIICGDGKKEETHTHNFEWSTIIEATCKGQGLIKGVCTCGATDFQTVEQGSHKSDRQGVCAICQVSLNNYSGEGISLQTVCDIFGDFGYEVSLGEAKQNISYYFIQDIQVGQLGVIYITLNMDGIEISTISIGDIRVDYEIEEPIGLAYVRSFGVVDDGRFWIELVDGTIDDYGSIKELNQINSKAVESIIINKQNILMVVYTDNSVKIAGKIAKTDINVSGGELLYISGDDGYYVAGVIPFKKNDLSEIVIPLTHRGIPVVGIEKRAFYKNKNITKVVLGDNVKYIGGSAFYECENLKTVVLGDKVEQIEAWAFGNCSKIQNLIIPYTVKYVREYAFEGIGFPVFCEAVKKPSGWNSLFKGETKCYWDDEWEIANGVPKIKD